MHNLTFWEAKLARAKKALERQQAEYRTVTDTLIPSLKRQAMRRQERRETEHTLRRRAAKASRKCNQLRQTRIPYIEQRIQTLKNTLWGWYRILHPIV